MTEEISSAQAVVNVPEADRASHDRILAELQDKDVKLLEYIKAKIPENCLIKSLTILDEGEPKYTINCEAKTFKRQDVLDSNYDLVMMKTEEK